MGRKKIAIARIQEERNRQVCGCVQNSNSCMYEQCLNLNTQSCIKWLSREGFLCVYIIIMHASMNTFVTCIPYQESGGFSDLAKVTKTILVYHNLFAWLPHGWSANMYINVNMNTYIDHLQQAQEWSSEESLWAEHPLWCGDSCDHDHWQQEALPVCQLQHELYSHPLHRVQGPGWEQDQCWYSWCESVNVRDTLMSIVICIAFLLVGFEMGLYM